MWEDRPRTFYQLKPREFEAVNPPRPPPPGEAAPAGTPAPPPAAAPIDVRTLAQQAMGAGPALGANTPANRPNEVHALLGEKYRRDVAAGDYAVQAGPDLKRRRRIRNFWMRLLAVDAAFGAIAWMAGPQEAIVFVCALGGIGMFTAILVWHTWCLRTD